MKIALISDDGEVLDMMDIPKDQFLSLSFAMKGLTITENLNFQLVKEG